MLLDNEAQIIAEALKGSQKAYESLTDRHRQAIFHIILKIVGNSDTAHDLVQETFMKAFSSLASYRSEYRFSTCSNSGCRRGTWLAAR